MGECPLVPEEQYCNSNISKVDHLLTSESGRHNTDGAGVEADAAAGVLVASELEVVDQGRGVEQGLTRWR